MITRSRSGADTFSRALSASPGPAMSSRSPGRCVPSVSKARSRTSSPLRGSSIRPRNPRAPPAPGQPGSGLAFSYRRTVTPLGMSTASPPVCSTRVVRAASDTAIHPLTFSSAVRKAGAAARVEALGLSQLLDRLDNRFGLLTGGIPTAAARQRSLAATVDWSYQLLSEPEQRVFRDLSVFPAPFTLNAAKAVAGPAAEPAVLHLVDCSMVTPPQAGPDGRARYGMDRKSTR